MSATFGGATSDDITCATINSNFADNTVQLIVGTFYPTTLTATRCFWGSGNSLNRAQVDATTSEIRVILANVTTPGQWLTSGAGISTNRWWFIAWLIACENTTVAGAVRVWVGHETQIPTEVTVTNPTARSGNFTGSTNFTVGNAGNGTVAFQGDIGWLSLISTANTVNGWNTLLPTEASGVIANSEADHVLKRWIIPLYLGRPPMPDPGALAGNFHVLHFPLWPGAAYTSHYVNSATPGSSPVGTNDGVLATMNSPFVVPPGNWPILHPYVRR